MSDLSDIDARQQQGCVILLYSGCASLVAFVAGFACAVILAAWGHW